MTRNTKPFTLTALHHIQLAIPPEGEGKCREFWGKTLGMVELEKPPELAKRGGCWFRRNQLEVHLGVEKDFNPAHKAHPAILVESLDDLAERLQSAGYDVIWDGEFPGHKRFYSADPWGNRIEFLESLATIDRNGRYEGETDLS